MNKYKILLSVITALCIVTIPFCAIAADNIKISADVFEGTQTVEAFFSNADNIPVSLEIVPSEENIADLSDPSYAIAAATYFNQITSDEYGVVSVTGDLFPSSGKYIVRMRPRGGMYNISEALYKHLTYDDVKSHWDNLVSNPEDNLAPLIDVVAGEDALISSLISDEALYDAVSKYDSIGEFTKDNAAKLVSKIKLTCKDITLMRETFDSIEKAVSYSQISKLLLSSDVTRVLLIDEYIERYNSLSNTKEVDKALVGRSFSDADEFASEFIILLEDAEYAESQNQNSRPSSGGGSSGGGFSGGGGGASLGANVPAPVVHIPPVTEQLPSISAPFNDTEDVPWAKEAINALYSSKIINGKSEGIFAPNDYILREEFVKMAVSLIGADLSDSSSDFTDVDSSAWYAPYVAAAKQKGIVVGREDGSFGIGEYISRQDVAVILERIIGEIVFAESENVKFDDESTIADYAKNAVSKLSSLKIINGSDNKFMPLSNATRAETACMIYRLLNLQKEVR